MENSEIIQELKEIKRLALIQSKEWLSVAETALLLDREESTIRKMAEKHILPYSRINGGRMLYFNKADINRILSEGYIPSIAQMINR